MKANPVRQQMMPNVRGMGLKDALYLLENMGLKVTGERKRKSGERNRLRREQR